MRLTLHYLPEAQFAETHSIPIDAAPSVILDTVERVDANDDPFIARLIGLREMPKRLLGRPEAAPPFGLHSFTRLERSERGIAYGLIGRFWRLDFGLREISDAAVFRDFAEPGTPKLVLCFETESLPDGRVRLVTQTRLFCPDRASRLKMRPYWLAIRLASGFIRMRMLRLVKVRAEA